MKLKSLERKHTWNEEGTEGGKQRRYAKDIFIITLNKSVLKYMLKRKVANLHANY